MPERGGTGTAEYRAFKACTPQLVRAIKGDLNVADSLFQKGLISEHTYDGGTADRTKARRLVTSVRGKIEEDKANFKEFCDILREEVYYEDLLKCLTEQKKNFTVGRTNNPKLVSAQKSQSNMMSLPAIVMLVSTIGIGFIVIPVSLDLAYNQWPQTNDLPQPQANVSNLLQVFRDYYGNISEFDRNQYLPKNLQEVCIPFTAPKLKRYNENYAKELAMAEVINAVEPGTKLAIIGRPGIGKSTLARVIVKYWANKVIFCQFAAVFHICLGRVATSITGLTGLLEEECHGILADDTHDWTAELSILKERIQKFKGNGVLIVLDAYDEYSFKGQKSTDYVMKLIKNISLPDSAIIMTSRPKNMEDIASYFTEVVEITGFNDTDIEEFVSSDCLGPPLGPMLESYFDQHPNVKKMCYLPLHMSMMIHLVAGKQDTASFADTETKVYLDFLYLTVENYRSEERHSWDESHLDNCFDHPHSQNSLCIIFKHVCEIAFNRTLNHQQNFNAGDLDYNLDEHDLEDLSLFNIKRVQGRRGSSNNYYFTHLTFQEFMTACHLLTLSEDEQTNMILKYGRNESVFSELVWKFFFGLVGEKRSHQSVLNLFGKFVENLGYKQLDSHYYQIDLYPLMFARETGKENESFAELLDYANITGPGNNFSLYIQVDQPFDILTYLSIEDRIPSFFEYALKWTPVKDFKMKLLVRNTLPDPRFCNIYPAMANMRTSSRELFSKYCSNIKTVHNNAIVIETEYFSEQTNMVPSVILGLLRYGTLQLISRSIAVELEINRFYSDRCVKVQAFWKPFPLQCPFDIMEIFKSSKLFKIIESLYPSKMYWRDVENEPTINVNDLNFLELKHLKLQDMGFNSFAIEFILQSSRRIQSIDLSHNKLYSIELLTKIPFLEHIEKLDLSFNMFDEQVLLELSENFVHLRSLKELNLSGNNFIGIMFPKSFGENLIHLKELRSLDLSCTESLVGAGLASSIQHLEHLQYLNLSRSGISTQNFENLVESFQQLPELITVDVSHNSIESIFTLIYWSELSITELYLSHNVIYHSLIDIAAILYSSLPSLTKIDLSHNLLCVEQEELRQLSFPEFPSRVEVVNLSYNFLFMEKAFSGRLPRVIYNSSMYNREIQLRGSIWFEEKLIRSFAACICRQHNNFHQTPSLMDDSSCFVDPLLHERMQDHDSYQSRMIELIKIEVVQRRRFNYLNALSKFIPKPNYIEKWKNILLPNIIDKLLHLTVYNT